MDKAELTFHPEAAKRFDERTQEILLSIQKRRMVPNPGAKPLDLHPAYVIQPADIISAPKFTFHHDATGEPIGVVWVSGNTHVGWEGPAFQPLKSLLDDIAETKPFSHLVLHRFLLEQTCHWLSEALERTRTDSLCAHITLQSNNAVRDYEIWIPLFQTYSSREFNIGDVAFKTFTREIVEEWWNRMPAGIRESEVLVTAASRKRSELQARLAASVRVRGEQYRAAQVALQKAENATALLRFLSPANLDSRLTSFCRPVSRGVVPEVTRVFMDDGRINEIHQGVSDRNTDWLLDESIALRPGVLENIQRLASDTSTKFASALYDALILYSRQALAFDVSDKLVFTLSALESMLLKDGNEPIQQNLGERMAFLTGQNVQKRKAIVKNVRDVYGVRSAFVHHGQTARHVGIVDQFLINAWMTFSRLIDLSVLYKTKEALIGALEDRKMS